MDYEKMGPWAQTGKKPYQLILHRTPTLRDIKQLQMRLLCHCSHLCLFVVIIHVGYNVACLFLVIVFIYFAHCVSSFAHCCWKNCFSFCVFLVMHIVLVILFLFGHFCVSLCSVFDQHVSLWFNCLVVILCLN